ncbi:hypothetical protein [Teredinibacter franksiae]|uniref:hypothetical protein n=1 Tax=Teredinibacter franksiae TaxID=2761453 RepID=UPI001628A7EC|nr:hypothetical protein [Teredinibacter franksiae]
MPPTFLVFLAFVMYAPLFFLVLLVCVCMHFTGKYSKYSMPVLAVYFAFPISIAIACLVALPAFLLSIAGVYLSEQYLVEAAYPVNVILVSLAAIFFFVVCYKLVKKLCLLAWAWALNRWPFGLFYQGSNKHSQADINSGV